MSETETKLDLSEIRARNLPRLRASELIKVGPAEDGDEPTEEEQAEIDRLMSAADAYLQAFLAPTKREKPSFAFGPTECIGCGKPLGGMLGTFEWGIAHGEGRCSNCGYPCRAKHRIKDAEGVELMTMNLTLQYHPDDLKQPD